MARRRKHSPEFKAKVALAALSNEKTVQKLSMEYGIHQILIKKWMARLKNSATRIFSGAVKT